MITYNSRLASGYRLADAERSQWAWREPRPDLGGSSRAGCAGISYLSPTARQKMMFVLSYPKTAKSVRRARGSVFSHLFSPAAW
jgi:hypothetical protein